MHGPPLRVLVVDPDALGRERVADEIIRLGHECRTASDGFEAWQLFQMVGADVVLATWTSPRMSGLELLELVRRADGLEHATYFVLMGEHDRERYVLGVEAGADDYRDTPIDADELRARISAAERATRVHRRLEAHVDRLRRESERSFALARTDPLTGIGNRLRMKEDLEVAWAFAKRYGRLVTGALWDVDRFKEFNDREGHVAGDHLLRRIAQALRAGLRRVDGLYRYGGEEFLILLPEQSLVEAITACDRLRANIEALRFSAPAPGCLVTASAGVAELDTTRDVDIAAWLVRMDVNLFRAKSQGRNRIEPSATDAS